MLGAFRVASGTGVVPSDAWRLRNADRLVKLLALAHGYRLHREEIIDALWPELDPGAAANNLRYTIHVARRVLRTVSSVQVLQRRGEYVEILPGLVRVDVAEFIERARQAQASRDADDYRRALEIYHGDLLPDDQYEDWCAWRRETLRTTYLTLLYDLATIYENAGKIGEAVACLEQIVDHEPTHEDAHVRLMRLHVRRGQRHRALLQFQMLQNILRQDLGVDPNPASQRLYQDILTGQYQRTDDTQERLALSDGPVTTASTARHNLPFTLTSFIGRGQEIESIGTLLKHHRLITLTGAGGSGKTRLAVEAARALVEDFPDGVWMIDLTTIVDRKILLPKVAAALKITEQPNQPLIDVLIESLSDRRLLLLLDNCEHLLASCSELAIKLIQACPGVQILATSRERLHIYGERTFFVSPLPLPPPRGAEPPERLALIESVQLFSERAALVQPEFRITAENAGPVARICEQLDGIPLAIELAAARLAVLTPEQLASRLDDAFAVLTDGSWSGVPRHRTLRATLDWSFGLLSPPEQVLFRRMSVFNNGCTLEACHAVCARHLDDSNVTLSYLAQLVDKSLVFVDVNASQARYRLLTVVRQYAAEQFESAAEASEVHGVHAEYFLELAESIEPLLPTHEHASGIQTLESELDNLRSALLWFHSDNPESALRLAGAFGRFWWARGHHKEGADWLSWLLTGDRAASGSDVRTKALSWAFLLTFRQGNYDVAHSFVREQLALARESNDTGARAWSLLYLSMLVGEGGDHAGELELLEEALVSFRTVGDNAGIARTLNSLGEAARYEEDYGRAIRFYEESLELWQELGDQPYVGLALHNLGRVVLRQGDTQRAARLFTEGLTNFHQMGTMNGIALCLSGLAGVAADIGDFELAARLLGGTAALRRELGAVEETLDHAQTEAATDAARRSLGASRFESSWNAGNMMSLDEIVAEATSIEARVIGRTPAPPVTAPLSPRERDVVALVAEGLTNAVIASRLGMSKRTADTHVSRILRKLGIKSRQQITEWANRKSIEPE